MVVICDDPDRENEGDLCLAAEFATAEKLAFMACQARGLICLSLPPERCDHLDLPLMVPANAGTDATGFTVSIEAREGVTTGISAVDRARTIQVAMAHDTARADLVRPGHVFPLRARPRGVLERRGQTEASVDLTRMARLRPGGVLCEVMNDDGTMARGPQLAALPPALASLVTVDQIAVYRRQAELAVTAVPGRRRAGVVGDQLLGGVHLVRAVDAEAGPPRPSRPGSRRREVVARPSSRTSTLPLPGPTYS
jgi:3,4-dihydroxy 2-butanone 4-phosphate synthase/GTP cyclohydrolase II